MSLDDVAAAEEGELPEGTPLAADDAEGGDEDVSIIHESPTKRRRTDDGRRRGEDRARIRSGGGELAAGSGRAETDREALKSEFGPFSLL